MGMLFGSARSSRTSSSLRRRLGLVACGVLSLSSLGFGPLGTSPDPASALAGDPTFAREWRLVEGLHWQITSPPGEAPEITDAREKNRGACGPGMVEVAGKMKRPQSFISKVESGERHIDIVEFLDLCRAIGTSPSTIIDQITR